MYKSDFYKKYISEKRGELNLLSSQLKILNEKYIEENLNYKYIVEAQLFLQSVAQKTQQRLSFHISDFVSSALESIWGEEAYTFRLDFVEKRNKTEVSMNLVDNNGIISLKDLNSVRGGGGVISIIGFALRIALWSLQRNKEKVIILDQPFEHLDSDHLPLAGELLKELSKKLGIQFLMINHKEQLYDCADVVFNVKKENGISIVTKK